MNSIKLTNPHSVLAALQTRPRDVLEVHASAARSHEGWVRVIEEARNNGVPVREPLQRESVGKRFNKDGGRIGTTFAIVRERNSVQLKELFQSPVKRGIWLALDQLQDPHNVGAVFRTASFFGVQGIVLTVDRSAPVSATVYDVAAGGVEHVPFTLQTNLARAIEVAKENDMWVLGSSEHAEMDLYDVDRDRRWLVVIGNEEKGLRRLTQERCDQVCRIAALGQVDSLNVSVAAGIMMSTLARP